MQIRDICYWRASEVSETLSGLNNGNHHIYVGIYVTVPEKKGPCRAK